MALVVPAWQTYALLQHRGRMGERDTTYLNVAVAVIIAAAFFSLQALFDGNWLAFIVGALLLAAVASFYVLYTDRERVLRLGVLAGGLVLLYLLVDHLFSLSTLFSLLVVGVVALFARGFSEGSPTAAIPVVVAFGFLAFIVHRVDRAIDPPPPTAEPSLSALCARDRLGAIEREAEDRTASNDARSGADGPLAGGATLRGATQTENDQDWVYFCAKGGQTTVRFVSPDDTSFSGDCGQLVATLRDESGDTVDELTFSRVDEEYVVTARQTLKADELYRVLIVGDGAECPWILTVGPPGSLIGDPRAPETVPCLPPDEMSAGANVQNGFEPNETISQAVMIDGTRLTRVGSTGDAALEVSGEIPSAEDEEWFAFCSTDLQRAVSLSLRNERFEEFDVCEQLEFALLDTSGRALRVVGVAEVEDEATINWTTEPNRRYYVRIAQYDSDECPWVLRVGPADALADVLPVAAWAGAGGGRS